MATSKLHIFLSYRSGEANFADILKKYSVIDFIGLVEVFLASDNAEEFRRIEENFKDLEQTCNEGSKDPNQQSHSKSQTIHNPHILCVTCAQFRELGYENQLQQVLNALNMTLF